MPSTRIIAEAGVNHNGDIELAKQLIDVAATAGADYVKFQTFKAKKIVSTTAQKAAYQIENTGGNTDGQLEMIQKLELDRGAHETLMAHCDYRNIRFISSPFDPESIDLLDELGLDLFKIPSGEITNLPYLKRIASKNKPVVLSTGMADLGEIEDALDILTTNGLSLDQITVLHCNTQYPTPFEDVNLKAMQTIQQAFGVQIGYSDHTLGIEVPIAAVALGATVIEKHFTLDRNMEGPDHRASLEPQELQSMIQAIRNIEQAVSGSGIKKPSPSESQNIDIVRKSLHLTSLLAEGQTLTEESVIPLRPGTGISPMQWDRVIGRTVSKDLPAGHQLQWEDLR